MTVKEAVKVLKKAETIVLGYGSNAVSFNHHDTLMLDAYGNYLVDEIITDDGKYYEVNIVMMPVKGA